MKKLLSVLLCLLLVFGMMPFGALAAAGGGEQINITDVDWDPFVYVKLGTSATLSVDVTAQDPSQVRYQWVHWVDDGVHNYLVPENIQGATGPTYTTHVYNDKEPSMHYLCKIYDDCLYAETPYEGYNAAFGSEHTVDFYLILDNEFRLTQVGYDVGEGAAYNVHPGDDLTLQAYATGIELDGMSWTGWHLVEEFGATLNADNLIANTASDTLVLQDLRQGGYYVCTAEDRFGSIAVCYFTVSIDNGLNVTSANGEYLVETEYGENAELEVSVRAWDPAGLTYRWYVDNQLVEDANGPTLTVENVTACQNVNCEVTDAYDNWDFCWFTVTVANNFSVERVGDFRQLVSPNASLDLGVQVYGDDLSDLEIEWSWMDMPEEPETFCLDANGVTSLHLSDIDTRQWVYCYVTDRYGFVQETSFIVMVDSGLDVQPMDCGEKVYVPYGGSVTLQPVVTVNDGIEYGCWWYTNSDWGEGDTVTLSNVTKYDYVCFDVYDGFDNHASVFYDVFVENGFTAVPVDGETHYVRAGDDVELEVAWTADNEEGIRFQWYELFEAERPEEFEEEEYRGQGTHWASVPLKGETGSSLVVEEVTEERRFSCNVTDCYNNWIEVPFQVLLSEGPFIAVQPTDFYAAVGDTAVFAVEAEGEGLSYQWWYRTSPEGAWTAVKNNGTAASYSLTVADRHNGYEYFCRVTDDEGKTADSSIARLSLSVPELRFMDRVWLTDENGEFIRDENGDYLFETDENGDPVLVPVELMTLEPGLYRNWQIWYGDKLLTAEDIPYLELSDGTVTVYEGEGVPEDTEGALVMWVWPEEPEWFCLLSRDWVEEDLATLTYWNTNLEEGNTVPISVPVPTVAAFSVPEVSKEDYLGLPMPYRFHMDPEETYFYIVCSEADRTIDDLEIVVPDYLQSYINWSQYDEDGSVWLVSFDCDYPAFDRADGWLSYRAHLSDGTWTEFSHMYIIDNRPALLWRWADWYYDDDGLHFNAWDWEPFRGSGIPMYPGQSMGIQLCWRDEDGELHAVSPEEVEISYPDMQQEFLEMETGETEDGFIKLDVWGFGECWITCGDPYLSLRSDLPDIGWYTADVFFSGNPDNGLLPEDEDEVTEQAWRDAHLAWWQMEDRNETVYLVARGGATLDDVWYNGSSGATVEVAMNGSYAAVTLDVPNSMEEWLDVGMNGHWGNGDAFTDHHRGIRVYAYDVPHLTVFRVRQEEIEGESCFVPADEGESGVLRIINCPGEDTYWIWLTEENLTASDLVSGDESIVTVEDLPDEEGVLRLRFHNFGETELTYTYTEYDENDEPVESSVSVPVRVELPGTGFYSVGLVEALETSQEWLQSRHIPEELAQEYYLQQWDYTGEEESLVFAAIHDHLLSRVWNESGVDMDVQLDESGKFAVLTPTVLGSDNLGIGVEGWWTEDGGDGNPCNPMEEHRGIWINDTRPGLRVRFTSWNEETHQH